MIKLEINQIFRWNWNADEKQIGIVFKKKLYI